MANVTITLRTRRVWTQAEYNAFAEWLTCMGAYSWYVNLALNTNAMTLKALVPASVLL